MTAEDGRCDCHVKAPLLLQGFDGRTEARFLLHDGELAGRTDAVARRWKLTGLQVGRASTSDIPLSSPVVSRQHAILMCCHDEVVVIDLRSANGTFVDGERIEPGHPVALHPGSELSFGHGATLVVSA